MTHEETTADAPAPDDPRKPRSPDDLTKPSWAYIVRKTAREFFADQATDLAAALTYYAVLAIAPALLVLVSLLGLTGDPETTVQKLLGIVKDLGPEGAVDSFQPVLDRLTQSSAAGFTLVVGLVIALWSASGYVAAFSRGMNRIYEIPEGRPFWKLRPVLLLITLALLVIAVLVVAALVLTGDVARAVGDAVGASGTFVTVWNVAKWPVVVLLVILAIALLYWATPNVRQPRFRWMSLGALVALVVWLIASVGFGIYVANFASYDKTYGSLGGVIVALLWLWLTNLALLFGAELDAEVERGRELQAGMPAEETIQLPPRDTKASDKKAAKLEEDVRRGRRLRDSAKPDGDDAAADRDADR
jgi:membrane protein